jgi:hypothetical protein
MKYNFLKSLAIVAALTAPLASCVNNDDYGKPLTECVEPAVTVNKTVAEVVAATTGAVGQYTGDDVIEAYVTSSDERGNFFKVVSLQTLPAQGSAPIGFSVAIDATTLFGQGFYPGKKVYIRLKNLYYALVDGSVKFGAQYRQTPTSPIEVGRIPQSAFVNSVVPSCSEVSEEQLVRRMTVAQALNNANINTLIELTDVQFQNAFVGKMYFDATDTDNTAGGSTNRTLTGAAGGNIVFRTSSFANFSGNKVPAGSGTVRGVLTKFGSTFQFLARSENDINLTGPRFANGGTALQYRSTFTENFESYTVTATSFPEYLNENTQGGRYWEVKTFSNNKYIEMTSFVRAGSPGVVANSYFFVPVDFTAANSFSFSKEIRFMAGQTLKVYYVTQSNYSLGAAIEIDRFVDITSSFTNLIYPAAGTSQNTFTTAGTYNIPETLTGRGYFVFEYAGGGTITTTVQIDDIVVN